MNPKSLNLESLRNAKSKVTLGFKCPAKVKLELANKAVELRISLSEYVESIVLNFYQSKDHLESSIEELKRLKATKNFYENGKLKHLFETYKGKSISYKNERGETVGLKLSNITDMYTLIINSFKIENTHD